MLLLFDTSTTTAVTALAVPEGRSVVGQKSYPRAEGGSALLLRGATELLASAEVDLDALTGLVINRGPGSYTGLRVGYALAQGLGEARGLPSAGVPSYVAFGEQFRPAEAALCVCYDARSRGVAWVTYLPGETEPLRVNGYRGSGRGTTVLELGEEKVMLQIAPAAAIPGLIPRPCRLVGPGVGAVRRAMGEVPPGDMECISGSDRAAPEHLFLLGARRLEEGGEDPVTTRPFYLGTMEAPPAARETSPTAEEDRDSPDENGEGEYA
jgi:tRNA threonylcarbamoyl adenosine modification protein YeaZ